MHRQVLDHGQRGTITLEDTELDSKNNATRSVSGHVSRDIRENSQSNFPRFDKSRRQFRKNISQALLTLRFIKLFVEKKIE